MNNILNIWEKRRSLSRNHTSSIFLPSDQQITVRSGNLCGSQHRIKYKAPFLADLTISIAGVQYTQFLLLFQCENLNTTHFSESVYIFSRTTSLDKSAETAINIFSNMTKLNIIDQSEMS